jgi:hypothetical protein
MMTQRPRSICANLDVPQVQHAGFGVAQLIVLLPVFSLPLGVALFHF